MKPAAFLIGLAIILSKAQLCLSSVDPEEVASSQHIVLERIHSLDESWTLEIDSVKDPTGAVDHEFSKFRTRLSDGRFRVDINDTEAGATAHNLHPLIFTFDGLQYQIFKLDQLSLVEKLLPFEEAYGATENAFSAYCGIFHGSNERTLEAIRDDHERWSNFSKNSRVVEEVSRNGHNCIGVRDSGESGPYTFTSYFAEDCEWYPVEVVESDSSGNIILKHDTQRLLRLHTPEGFVYIPAESTEQWFTTGHVRPTTTITWLLDPSRLQINCSIDYAVFSIPRSAARSVTDFDHPARSYYPDQTAVDLMSEHVGRLPKLGVVAVAGHPSNSAIKWSYVFSGAALSVLIIGLMWLFRKSRLTSKSKLNSDVR